MQFSFDIKGAFRSYQGRHFTSRWVRKLLERGSIRKWLGYQLATATFVAAIADPIGSVAAISAHSVPPVAPEPIITGQDVKTETSLSWPVTGVRLTQGYRYGHPGIDVQGSPPIFPVDHGTVTDVLFSKWGYGNHVYVSHKNGRSSLYAHLSKVNVVKGQDVTRDTILGTMGRTGWATGIHLHLEIYQDGVPVNPLSVLPGN